MMLLWLNGKVITTMKTMEIQVTMPSIIKQSPIKTVTTMMLTMNSDD